jgi:hypothetical protein
MLAVGRALGRRRDLLLAAYGKSARIPASSSANAGSLSISSAALSRWPRRCVYAPILAFFSRSAARSAAAFNCASRNTASPASMFIDRAQVAKASAPVFGFA